MIQRAKSNLIDFAIATDPKYEDTWYHETIASILQAGVEKVERGEDARIIIQMPPRAGKLIAHNTPILTTKGWTTHGKLKVGDYVFNSEGKPAKVLACSEETNTEFLVKFSDGSIIECHGNHEWVVSTRGRRKPIIMETKELYNSILIADGIPGMRGCRYRFQIDPNVPVNFRKRILGIHPYVLGAWLGDGTFNKNCITHSLKDLAIVKKIEGLGYEVTGQSVHKDTGVYTTYFRRLYGELIAEGFLQPGRGKTKLGNKCIPNKYLCSSRKQRLELLAGLIDTDGYMDSRGRYVFSTCSKRLAEDVHKLVVSLGSRAYTMKHPPRLSTSGIKGNKAVYRVGFNVIHTLPVALSRKSNKGIAFLQRKRSIIAIEKVKKPTLGKCIEVEGGIYLVGKRLVPTHNSELATKKAPAWILGRHPDWPIIVASYSGDLATKFGQQTRDIMFSSSYQTIFDTRLREDSKSKSYWVTKEDGGYNAVGAGGALTGFGFKCGIIDDIFKNREEAESQTIRDSRWDWYRSTFYTRQEGATAIFIINTRWHTDDLVGRLIAEQEKNELENPDESYDKWTVINLPAIATEDEAHRKKGESFWPEKYPIEKLKKTERALGPYEFAALYQGSPITSENQEFKESWFKYRTWEEVEALDTRKFATIDPGGKNPENDYTGIVRNYVDKQNNWNIKAMGLHIDSMELMNIVFQLHDEGFEKIGIEETVYLKALKPFFDDECRKRNKFPNVVPLKQPTVQKEVRIRGLIPRYSSGSMYHITGACKDLEDQLKVFPKGANDDVPDALAMQFEVAEAPMDDYAHALIHYDRESRKSEIKKQYGL